MADTLIDRHVDATVAIFARVPVLGRVKTRLASHLGDARALAAHEQLLARTIAQLRSVAGHADLELWFDERPGNESDFDLPVCVQSSGDLGVKMASAIQAITVTDRAAVIVGSDCPLLDGAYVRSALTALAQSDVVIGPAEDGGYVLIAMRRPIPNLFINVRWGTGAVLADTLAQARAERVSVRCLNALWDVDEPADWRRYQVLRARELSADASPRVPARASAVRL